MSSPRKRTKKPLKATALQPGEFDSYRAKILFLLFMSGFAILVIRAIWLQVLPPSPTDLNKIANSQYRSRIRLSPFRGAIYDRRGDPLAISIRKPSVFVNPRVFDPKKSDLRKLSRLLGMSRTKLEKISKKTNYFAWLKRKVDPETLRKVESLQLDGLYHTLEPARFYPTQSLASNLLGYVNIDDIGMAGIEQQYNSVLQGDSKTLWSRRDAKGNILFEETDKAIPQKPGRNIKLTIDRAIQEITTVALRNGVKNANAQGGIAIVSDPHTGRILAMSSSPTFDPNQRKIAVRKTANRAIQDGFEPGSVMKSFVIAEAIERTLVSTQTKFDCEDGVYRAGGVRFRDSHKPEKQFLTVAETFTTSSNVCTFKIAELIGPQNLYRTYQKLGFGERKTQLHYPAQAFGYLSHWQKWKPIRFANLAFGQGVFTTGLEVVQAIGAFANGGELIAPQLVDSVENADGTWEHLPTKRLGQVYSPKTAKIMRELMAEVVEKGAIRARMDRFTAGGKTGTSQKIDQELKRYSQTKYWSIFSGMAPINDPHLVILVVVDEPDKRQRYGSLWAAPVFKEIAEKSLIYLNVAPDKPTDIAGGHSKIGSARQ